MLRYGWALFGLLAVTQACASDFTLKAFGHQIVAKGKAERLNDLVVDGETLLSDKEAIELGKATRIGKTGVVFGTARDGGFACEATPFLVVFPPGGKPRIDVLESCRPMAPKVKGKVVEYRSKPLPGIPGETFHWTPEKGVETFPETPYEARRVGGWNALRAQRIHTFYALLKYDDVLSALQERSGTDLTSYTFNGEAGYRGEVFLASACQPHFCASTGVFVAIDIPHRGVYVAWYDEDNHKIIAKPTADEWPEKLREELNAWSAAFSS